MADQQEETDHLASNSHQFGRVRAVVRLYITQGAQWCGKLTIRQVSRRTGNLGGKVYSTVSIMGSKKEAFDQLLTNMSQEEPLLAEGFSISYKRLGDARADERGTWLKYHDCDNLEASEIESLLKQWECGRSNYHTTHKGNISELQQLENCTKQIDGTPRHNRGAAGEIRTDTVHLRPNSKGTPGASSSSQYGKGTGGFAPLPESPPSDHEEESEEASGGWINYSDLPSYPEYKQNSRNNVWSGKSWGDR